MIFSNIKLFNWFTHSPVIRKLQKNECPNLEAVSEISGLYGTFFEGNSVHPT